MANHKVSRNQTRDDDIYLDEENTDEHVVCGNIMLIKSGMRYYYSCSFCGICIEEVGLFLKHMGDYHIEAESKEVPLMLTDASSGLELANNTAIDQGNADVSLPNEVTHTKIEILDSEENRGFDNGTDCTSQEPKKINFLEKFQSFIGESNNSVVDVEIEENSSFTDKQDAPLSYEDFSDDSSTEQSANTGSFELVILKSDHDFTTAKRSRPLKRQFLTRDDLTCKICGKIFVGIRGLKNHLRRHGDKIHACDLCEARFTEKGNLRVHRFRHLGIKPHCCTMCSKRFTSTTELTLHVRSHTGERPYKCSDCDRSFTCSAHLTTHRRRHNDDRRFVCATCGKRCFDLKQMRDHEIAHSSERPYACEICQLKFSRRKALSQHAKLHSAVKQYACKLCPKTFAQGAGLYSHMKSRHAEKSDSSMTKSENIQT